MLLNFEHLKTFYSALKQKMKNFRGNWNQNDPTADDYIKNRPFYSEGAQEVTILHYTVDTDAGSAPMISAGPMIYTVPFDAEGLQPFVVDQEYSIKWNNKIYTCKAKLFDDIPALGDTGLVEGYVDTGEPFLIAIAPEGDFGVIITTEAGKYPITITMHQEIVHKLDKKFIDIPDNLVTTDILEEVYEDLQSSIPDNIVTYDNISDALPEAVVTTDELATVATTGSYNDLSDIPDEQLLLKNQLKWDNIGATRFPIAAANGRHSMALLAGTGSSVHTIHTSYDRFTWKQERSIGYSNDPVVLRTMALGYSDITRDDVLILAGEPSNYFVTKENGSYVFKENNMPDNVCWSSIAVTNYDNMFILVSGLPYEYPASNASYLEQYKSSIAAVCTFTGYDYRWVQTSLPAEACWTNVVTNPRLAAHAYAISIGDVAAYSNDTGATWTQSTMPVSAAWRWLASSPDTVIAISEEGYAAYSKDYGKTWSLFTSEEDRPLTGPIIYSGGEFISFSASENDTFRYSDSYLHENRQNWYAGNVKLPESCGCAVLIPRYCFLKSKYNDVHNYWYSQDNQLWASALLRKTNDIMGANNAAASAVMPYILANPHIGLVGSSDDTADKNTIYGAKSYTDERTQVIDVDVLDDICAQMRAGLYSTGAIDLYNKQGQEGVADMLNVYWDDLIKNDVIKIENTRITGKDKSALVGEIVIPRTENITRVTFYQCNELTGIALPDSLTTITYPDFTSCDNLTNIIIPDGVTSIGENAFNGCNSLTNVAIGDNVSTIGEKAFYQCTNLASITIPDSVSVIYDSAFEYCDSPIDVYIADLTKWCNIDFKYNSNPLQSGGKLYLNGELVTDIVIPDSIDKIHQYTFRGCSSIKNVTIPDNVTRIDKYAFWGCNNLSHVAISKNVTSINIGAFMYCSSLTTITIPSSVTYIDARVFESCEHITNITFDGTIEQWNAITLGNRWNYNVPATYVQCTDGQVSLT